ncbi:hypothetical protein EFU53_001541 [Vibrio cholerae]|uniref:hypothetical protein n=1 Tax=Vibrio TaxID=662 RepID=UPI0002C17904|nr:MULTISPECIES: hypothetical protein [Vibrio]EMP93046.1 hypothetical protein VC87395_001765 [Vibrio paracholerae 87395]KFD82376.1 hypothetical protein DA89_270 [Vibrio paracholerae]MCO7014400.1 hypothetical protein [Vibrio paracholerae]MCO7022727.1 hypothetical protein [Vibrio paracholerae]QAV05004.1 hypothetical protein FORC76_1507 [Vibrio cholerae]
MRLAHKRKVQAKLQKRIKAIVANLATVKSSTTVQQPAQSVHSKALSAHQSEQAATPTVTCQLTPKQQQVLEIVRGAVEGINPKAIGLLAGQEEAKASAWAAGALKKLLDEKLVEKNQVGNKVTYTLTM